MDKTGTGVRLKSQRGRGGTVENITYRRILMNDIEGDCIQINLNCSSISSCACCSCICCS